MVISGANATSATHPNARVMISAGAITAQAPIAIGRTKDETIANFTALYKDVSHFSLNNLFQSGAILSCDEALTRLDYEKIYVEVSNCPELDRVPNCRVLPAGLYVCINNTLTDSQSKSEQLLEYLRRSGIKPRLIVEEYVFTDFIEYDNPKMALQILE